MDRLRYQPPHPLTTEIFRAYDIRGIVDKQLSDAMLYHIGLAVGTQVKRNGEDSIAVGPPGPSARSFLPSFLIHIIYLFC